MGFPGQPIDDMDADADSPLPQAAKPREEFLIAMAAVNADVYKRQGLNYPCGPEPFLRDAEPGFALPL